MSEDEIGNHSDAKLQVDNISESDNEYDLIGRITAEKEPTVNRTFVSNDTIRTIRRQGAVPRERDPELLKSYANQTIASVIIDTIAKDASSADYVVNGDVDLNEYFPDYLGTRSVIEGLSKSVLQTGEGYIGREKTRSGNIERLIPVSPSTIWIKTDDYGNIESYIHKTKNMNRTVEVPEEDVYMFPYSIEVGSVYPKSPTEPIIESLEMLNEIEEKELLQYQEGSPSGIITQVKGNEQNPMNTTEFEKAKNLFNSSKGSLHEILFMRGKMEFIRTAMGVDELDISETYERKLKEVASAYHVSPSYAGFLTDSVNKATEEAKRKNYKEKGLRMILKQIEEVLDKIVKDLADDPEEAGFKFELPDEKDNANYYKDLAEASIALTDANINHMINENDKIVIEDQELRPMEALTLAEDAEESEKEDEKDYNLTSKQRKFQMNYGKPIDKALEQIHEMDIKADEKIEMVRSNVDSNMSKGTYYRWLDNFDLRNKEDD